MALHNLSQNIYFLPAINGPSSQHKDHTL